MENPSLIGIDIRTIFFVVFAIAFSVTITYLIIKGVQAIKRLNRRKTKDNI